LIDVWTLPSDRIALLVILFQISLSACSPAATPEIIPEATNTPDSDHYPDRHDCLVSLYLHTDTFPHPVITPTQDYRPDLGEVLLSDDFSNQIPGPSGKPPRAAPPWVKMS